MERYNFEHSLKNIPIPTEDSYLKMLIAKTGDFIERIRWKVFFHLNPNAKPSKPLETYGFKTNKQAPQSKELNNFEQDIYGLVSSIEFKDSKRNNFQTKLLKHVKHMKKSDKLFILADKTTNIYQMTPDNYNKLLTENITKDYEKANPNTVKQTSKEAKNIADKLEIADRIEDQSNKAAYITLKDHKDDFLNKPKCRLINPAKTQIGRISKQLIEKINSELRAVTGLQQWRSTEEVLTWFTHLKHKSRQTFMQIDIVEYYPSISNTLLDKALHFASQKLNRNIDPETIHIIKHARNTFLYTTPAEGNTVDRTPWRKKSGPFDVTMGAPDGAEVCELVGLMLLEEIRENFPELNFGLYRDDGLAAHKRIPGPRLDTIRKELHRLFAKHNLKVTVETSRTKVNFLDVTLDLNADSHAPYRKPNDTPLYINIHSNHPPNIIKEIPETINKRLNKISSSKANFEQEKHTYEKALTDSGYKSPLVYTHSTPTTSTNTPPKMQNTKRKRDIVWFNPPFNLQVKTNVGKQFLKIIDKNFPTNHPLRKVINRNCVKVSYSCTPNIKTIMQTHNTNKLQQQNKQTPTRENNTTCNCRDKNKCPLDNKCNSGPIVYKAIITNKQGQEAIYIGSTQNFKQRHANHKASFKDPKLKNATTLSKYAWTEELGPEPNIKWTTLKTSKLYAKGGRYCDLCLTEKLCIAKALKDPRCINKRTELVSRCAHKARFKLSRM